MANRDVRVDVVTNRGGKPRKAGADAVPTAEGGGQNWSKVVNSDPPPAPDSAASNEPQTDSGKTLTITLPPRQMRAMTLLVAGRTYSETSRLCGISRTTLANWRQDPAFQAALREKQRELFDGAVGRLRLTLVRAVKEIDRDLRTRRLDHRLTTAFRLLPYVGAKQLEPVRGEVKELDPIGAGR